MTACQMCGCESVSDPCSRCESETHWTGSDRASYSRGITRVYSGVPGTAQSAPDRRSGPATCICGQPTQMGCGICRGCERSTRHHLADMESHRRELLTALTRQVRMTAPNDGGRSSSGLEWAAMGDRFLAEISEREVARILATLPPALKPAVELHAQKALLVSWVKAFMEDEPALPMPADTVASLSAHLASWLPVIRKHEIAGEFVAEVREQVKRIFAVIDTPNTRTKVSVGPCPETLPEDGHGEQECPGEVVATFPADEAIPPTMKCDYCKTEWQSEQWNHAGVKINRRLEAERRMREIIRKAKEPERSIEPPRSPVYRGGITVARWSCGITGGPSGDLATGRVFSRAQRTCASCRKDAEWVVIVGDWPVFCAEHKPDQGMVLALVVLDAMAS